MEPSSSESHGLKTPQRSRVVSSHNTRLINLNAVVERSFVEFYKLKTEYGLNDSNSTQCISIFYHTLIISLCEYIKTYRGKNAIVIYIDTEIQFPEFKRYKLIISQLFKAIPLRSIASTVPFDQFIHCVARRDAECLSTLDGAVSRVFHTSNTNKFNVFLRRYNLKFLLNTYFKSPNNKMLIGG